MATFNTSGATQDGNTPYYMAVTWSETAVDTLNNRSTVTIKAVATGGSSSYYSYWRNNTFKVTDQSGNVLVNKSNSASTQYFNGDTVWEVTFTVDHVSTTGAASITVELSSGVYNASNITSANQTLNLTTIARASTISVADNLNITANSGNLAVSIVSKGNYYHKLQYRFNGAGSWVNLADKKQVNNTTAAVNLPISTILAGIVTSNTGTVNFQLLTYTSSAESTQVGATQTDSTSITIDISKTALQPVVSTLTAAAASGNKISGYIVAGYDKATITFAMTKAPGGSSSGYKVTTYFSINQGFTMATKSTTSVSGTVNTNTAPASESNKTVTVSAYAVDSRGATSATKTTTFTCRGYSTPVITANFFRCVSNTDKTADEAGLGATGTFSTAVGNSVDSKNTIQSTTCEYAKNGSGSTAFTSGKAFAIAESDTITFTITTTDKVTSITKTYTIPSAIYPIDFYQSGSSTGIGLGTIATSGRINLGLVAAFKAVDRGIMAVDPGDKEYGMIYQNSSNLWIGACQGSSRHHRGATYISAGWTGDEGSSFKANKSIYISIPATRTTQSAAHLVYHDGYHPSADTANVANNLVLSDRTTNIGSGRIIFGATGGTGTKGVSTADSLMFNFGYGTTSSAGWSEIILGNSKSSGTAGNQCGVIRLYATNDKYIHLRPDNAPSANRTQYLPDFDGIIALEPVKLYENATGTTGTVTLSETAANFTYLDIYYYTSHGSGSTPKRMSHVRVYDPDGQKVALTNTVYWSNELLISQSQIAISGKSITRLSNEQAQFKLTTNAVSRTATTTNIYIYRVDGYR